MGCFPIFCKKNNDKKPDFSVNKVYPEPHKRLIECQFQLNEILKKKIEKIDTSAQNSNYAIKSLYDAYNSNSYALRQQIRINSDNLIKNPNKILVVGNPLSKP